MKFSCEKAILLSAVSTVSRAVSPKSSIPALEGILLQAEDVLTVSGYNMQTGIRTDVDAQITEAGSLVLNSRLFGDILRRLPDDVISFTSDDRLNVHMVCGDSSFDISAMSASDYPDLPLVEQEYSFTIPQRTLRAMIGETSFAVSTNEARPIHTGALFEVEAVDLTMVAVDGFRLALRKEPITRLEGGAFRFVAPAPALSEVEKICQDTDDEASVTLGNRHLLFEMGSTQLICRRLEGEFLDYKTAIPRTNPLKIQVDTKTMISSIDRVSVVISDKQKSPVRCVFENNKVSMSVKTANGDAKDICKVSGDGKNLEIGFNNRYLLEALKYAPADTVQLELNTGISPCVITPVEGEEKFLYMVLPVRLKK